MLASTTRALGASVDKSTMKKPGWLFVLPWSLKESGGVNHVVNTLIRYIRDDRKFLPLLLITTETKTCSAEPGTGKIGQFFLDVWSPIDDRHVLRSLLSFIWRFPYRYRTLRRIVLQQNVHIINPHFPNLNALLFVALKLFGTFGGQIVLSFHGSDVNALLSTAGLERRLWKLLLRGVDQIVVVSNSLGIDLVRLEPSIAGKVNTVYNGVDLGLFDPTFQTREFSRSDPPDAQTIVSIGAFVPAKGHDVLLHAFSIVAGKIPHVRLVIVGRRDSESQRILGLIDTLLLKDRVDIFEDVPYERVITFLSNADVFALASRREGFGLVVIEAAAARVPVVCTRVGGLCELVKQGTTGTLVDVEDHVGLAEALISILRNPLDAKRMAANFYEHVKVNLTWDRTYQKYLWLLDRRVSSSD